MENEDSLKRRRAWSAYWAAGTLHSCANSYKGNYRGAIAEFWSDVFASLPHGSHLLDIATGNGALPLMLSGLYGQVTGITVDAVDLADVAPAWHASKSQPWIQFHTGVRMEQLPFETESFDMVVSQYGIEYGKWPDALDEGLRVCRQSGALALVLHHSDSLLVSVGRNELQNHAFLANPRGLIDSARRVVPWIKAMRLRGAGSVDLSAAQECRAAYNLAMKELAEQIDLVAMPDLLFEARQEIHRLVSEAGATDVGEVLAKLARYSEALSEADLRTSEMVAHALDQPRIEAMKAYLCSARPNWTVNIRPISQAEGLLGWGVVAAAAEHSAHGEPNYCHTVSGSVSKPA